MMRDMDCRNADDPCRALALAVIAQAPDPSYQYVLGFADIHNAHPAIVGDPLENEAGIVQGNSFQRTSKGWLYWETS